MALGTDSIPSEVVRPLKRSEYQRLADLGSFEGERVELLYGRIVRLTPQREPHAFGVTRVTNILLPALLGRAAVRVQMPFLAPGESVPEPDIAVVPPGDYLDAHPAQALLIVEVSESSLAIDRAKARLYAQARVPEYWVVDAGAGAIERYSEPEGTGYRAMTRHERGEALRVIHFDDVIVRVEDVVPPAK